MTSAHYISEFWRGLRRSPLTYGGVGLLAALLFTLFDLIWVGSEVADRHFVRTMSGVTLEVFVDDEVEDIAFMTRAAKVETMGAVASVEIITKEMARERLAITLGQDYLTDATANPLPRSFIVSFKEGAVSSAEMERLEQDFASWVGTRRIVYSKDWLAAAERDRSTVRRIFLVILVATFAGSALNTSLTTALIIRARAAYIRQMRLLGAGALHIAIPFALEGAFVSGLAATLGWSLIFFVQERVGLPLVTLALPELRVVFGLIGLFTLTGLIGAIIGLRSGLRHERI